MECARQIRNGIIDQMLVLFHNEVSLKEKHIVENENQSWASDILATFD